MTSIRLNDAARILDPAGAQDVLQVMLNVKQRAPRMRRHRSPRRSARGVVTAADV
jgi:hypothetical protein